MKGIRAII